MRLFSSGAGRWRVGLRARAYVLLVLAIAGLLYGSSALEFWWSRRDLFATLEREGLLASYWLARAGELSLVSAEQRHAMLEGGTRLLLRVLEESAEGRSIAGLPPIVQLRIRDGRVLFESEEGQRLPRELIQYLGSQPDLLEAASHLTSEDVPFLAEGRALITEPGGQGTAWIAEVEEARDEAGLSSLIRQTPLGGDIVYFALQDGRGILAATPNVVKLDRIDQSDFLKSVLSTGTPATRQGAFEGKRILEIARVFPGSSQTLLRVGMSLDGLKSIEMKGLIRLGVSTGALVLGIAVLLGYLFSQQHLAALDRAYQRIETQSRSIIDGMSDGLLAVDDAGRIVTSNPAAARILGTRSLDGAPLSDVAPLCHDERGGGGEPRRVTLPGGIEIEICCNQLPEGKIILLRDVTHLRRVERSLAEAEKLAFLGRMGSELAHEIRNPLNAISMSTQMLEREGPQPALVATVRREIGRLNRLVESFLGFRKIPDEPWIEADAAEIVEEVVSLFAPEAAGRDIAIRSDVEPIVLRCRRDRLKQALINVVKNSIEAVPAGGQCAVSVRPDGGGMVRISVEDSGPGIPADQRRRVFEPFVTLKPGGSGLGLSVAGLIVREHGGEIEVGESGLGGAMVTLSLPVEGP